MGLALSGQYFDYQLLGCSDRVLLQKKNYLFLLLLCERVKLQTAEPFHQIRHERRLIVVGLSIINQSARDIGKMKRIMRSDYVYYVGGFSGRDLIVCRA